MTDYKCPYCGSNYWRAIKMDKEYLPANKKVTGYQLWWCTCNDCRKGFYLRNQFSFVDADVFRADSNDQQAHWLEK